MSLVASHLSLACDIICPKPGICNIYCVYFIIQLHF